MSSKKRKKSRPVKAKVPVREHKDERKEKIIVKKKGGKKHG